MANDITHAADCASHQGVAYRCTCGAWKQKAPPSNENENLNVIIETLRENLRVTEIDLANAQKERDEAIMERKQAEATVNDLIFELSRWTDAAREGLKKGAAMPPNAIQSIQADEGAIRAIVDALENEHRHIEKIAEICEGTNWNAQTESYARMKSLADLLERLCNTPLVMPRETSNT